MPWRSRIWCGSRPPWRFQAAMDIWTAEKWGWTPAWDSKPARRDINATREKAARSKYFRQIWPHRALVCADGWYEWCVVEGEKAKPPYYISRADDEPLFLPAIGQFSEPSVEPGGHERMQDNHSRFRGRHA
ncbi:SOS response-associated peptidase family protein [Pseudomonas sp. CBC3]|uniref:SOS response-associated peptidase family protein n=1 Tax=Pseudomonas sp. CBC3 TaxID=3123318 RepID=UPI0040406D7C